jgi:hypothetical protein
LLQRQALVLPGFEVLEDQFPFPGLVDFLLFLE